MTGVGWLFAALIAARATGLIAADEELESYLLAGILAALEGARVWSEYDAQRRSHDAAIRVAEIQADARVKSAGVAAMMQMSQGSDDDGEDSSDG